MTQSIITIKKLTGWTCLGLAACLLNHAAAQDSHWSGPSTDTLWSNPNNWNPIGVPPPGNATTAYAGNVWLQPVAGVPALITIAPGDVESPGVGNSVEDYNTIFGPESGSTLNIYGTLNFDWTIVPWQVDPTPGLRSYINMYSNAVMSTTGASLNLGDGWWTQLRQGPYCTVNMYNSSSYSSLGGAGLWLGGHLNIYDNATFWVNGYVNMDNAQANNDGTRSLNLGGGTLILPPGFAGNAANWITRGVLRAYGKGYDTGDIVITDNLTNVFVTTVPLGGALQRIYFQPLSTNVMMTGAFQQTTLVGDYPAVTGVLLSSSEPGLSPTNFAHPVYTSSNPRVVSVDTNGMITAVSPGSATLTAKVGLFSSTNSLAVTVVPMGGNLIHRYSFSETTGTTSADLVAGNSPTWDATLNGGVTLGGGQAALDGSTGYIQLPAGIVSGLDEITVETWVSFVSPINTWANVFAFGDTDGAGAGMNYVTLQPHTGGNTTSLNFGQGDPGNAGERDAVLNTTLDGQTNMHIVVVYHPKGGYEALYTNGVLAATVSMFNNLIDPVALAGPAFKGQSILPFTLGADNLNYIGHSLYSADPTLNASIDEFRIYDGPLSAARIMADHALGSNQLIGTATNVSLTATKSGGNVVVKWPTTSALVSLVSSPTLGAGAVWTPVTGNLTAASGNYQMTVPNSGAAAFFRLTQ
jgi:hypothetical protein